MAAYALWSWVDQNRKPMTLEEILCRILGSRPDDWEYIADWRGDANPERAVLRTDLSVALEWGRGVTDPVSDGWTQRFTDKHAVGLYVDVMYTGSVVYRDYAISVDGGRCILPHPQIGDDGKCTTSVRQAALARVVHALSGGSYDFEEYMRRSGIVAV
jgi:hypothetical protein